MKNIYVEKCCECPFTNVFSLDEWNSYDCEFKPEGIDKEGIGENGRRYIISNGVPANTERPPDWCPLRKEEVIIVQLTMKWALEEVDGKS